MMDTVDLLLLRGYALEGEAVEFTALLCEWPELPIVTMWEDTPDDSPGISAARRHTDA